MSRNNVQVKKAVPFKLRGAERNPYGENVIIDRDIHYGSKNGQMQRSSSQPMLDHANRLMADKEFLGREGLTKNPSIQATPKLLDKNSINTRAILFIKIMTRF